MGKGIVALGLMFAGCRRRRWLRVKRFRIFEMGKGIVALGLMFAAGFAQGATRVALVSPDRREPARNALALAEAKLSAARDVELLERTAIDKVLAEQKLTLAGVIDSNQAVAVGKLLGVDVFGVVETDPTGKEVLGLVVFDAATGVRLTDTALPADGANAAAEAVAGAVSGALRKRAAGPKQLCTVCLLGVRNADLPRDRDAFCEGLALILERRLLISPTIAVLERRRLEHVRQEKALPAEQPDKELLASVLLMELEVSRGRGPRELRVVLTVSDSKGKPLTRIAAQAEEAKVEELVGALLSGAAKFLKTVPGGQGSDKTREAYRFFREARLLWNQNQLQPAIRTAEAAAALDPGQPDMQAALAQYLIEYGTSLLYNRRSILYGTFHIKVDADPLKTALAAAGRGLEVRADALARLQPKSYRNLGADGNRNMRTREAMRFFLNKLPYVDRLKLMPQDPGFDAEIKNLLDWVLEAADRELLATLNGWAEAALQEPASAALDRYTMELPWRLEQLGWLAATSPSQAGKDIEIVRRWLEVSARLTTSRISVGVLSRFLENVPRFTSLAERVGTGPADPDDPAALAELFQSMAQHPHPLVKLYGRYALLKLGKKTQVSASERAAQYQDIKKTAYGLIENPPLTPADDLREGSYKFLLHAIESAGVHNSNDAILDDLFELCDFMLNRKEIEGQVFEMAVASNTTFDGNRARLLKRLELVNRGLSLAESPEMRKLWWNKAFMKSKLEETRHVILTRYPDLAPAKRDPRWDRVVTLLELSKFPEFQALMAPTVSGNSVFVLGGGVQAEQPFLELIRVPLAGGSPKLLGRAAVHLKPVVGALSSGSWSTRGFVSACFVADGIVYVGTRTDGILAFPETGAPGQPIRTSQGLPSPYVQSMAFLGGRIYAGLEGGYLVAIDPGNSHVEVLASSRRKEKLTPFDDREEQFSIPYLVADPERRRVLFVMHEATPKDLYQVGPSKDSTNGLWEFNVGTREFRRLVRLYSYPMVSWGSPVRNGRILLSSHEFALEFDLARNQPHLLRAFNPVSPELTPERKEHFGIGVPHLYRQGWLWSPAPFGRISIPENRQELLPPLVERSGFWPTSLDPLGEDELLVGDPATLWVIKLREGK
jgi:hypothetical protein